MTVPPFSFGMFRKSPDGRCVLVANVGYGATADIISTVEFDHTGNYLATGDKGGRVVLFERNETVSRSCPASPSPAAVLVFL
jgi:hypothetical protein